ncbi:hypothetical protein AOC36_01280 [Erysipelothrix larvae]|uniref:non-specific protein-tyrosine kinase n=1 Tax=Erysipelothrix larvae TaxID=1514105 RepID=A0A109UGJ1_9FIRM|nr:CpsD/CapB family tyrosine-protein kinase [Erysipelothrix larvae]AMC92671.1 hypothetical protein AOC36_01280 [Erysipelothrix larvae]
MFRKKVKKNKLNIFEGTHIIHDESPFAYLEGYKSLRTNLSFLTYGGEVKTILVTSSVAHEGKSTIAINLARSLAMAGNYVLLIDGDLRAPVIQKYLKITNNINNGLSSVLANKIPAEEAIYKYPAMEIEIMFSGPIPPNAVELLSKGRAKRLIGELRERYDYIIIDSPPSGIVTDAKVLSQSVDGLLYVVRQNFAEKDLIKRTTKDYIASGTNILGVVFNNFTQDNFARKRKFNNYYSSED